MSEPWRCRAGFPACRLRVCAKINSGFAGGDFAFWRGTTKEHSQGSATEEKRSQKAKSPQPSGARRGMAGCGVARRSQPQNGDAPSSRLASGQAALPPKPEVIFAQTLRERRGRRGRRPRHARRVRSPRRKLSACVKGAAGVFRYPRSSGASVTKAETPARRAGAYTGTRGELS